MTNTTSTTRPVLSSFSRSLRQLGTHATRSHVRGMWRMFEVTTCDHCGIEAIAPNAISVKATHEQLDLAGIEIRAAAPTVETFWSDDLGDVACDNCCSAAAAKAAAAVAAPVAAPVEDWALGLI